MIAKSRLADIVAQAAHRIAMPRLCAALTRRMAKLRVGSNCAALIMGGVGLKAFIT
jgi:hypothetical protein